MKAKRFTAIMLCAAIGVASAFSVSASEASTAAIESASENTESASEAVGSTAVVSDLGKWNSIPSGGIGYLTDEEYEILQKAYEGSDDSFGGVAVLGTQVVSGTNYAFLGQTTIDGVSTWAIAIVYQDLEGNVSLTSVKAIDISKYVEEASDINYEQLAGGWTVTSTRYEVESDDAASDGTENAAAEATDAAEPAGESKADEAASEEDANVNAEAGDAVDFTIEKSQITDSAAEAITAATKDTLDVSYGPIAEIAMKQTETETDYAILCKAATVADEPATGLAIVVVSEDADGNYAIANIAGLNLADFAE